MQFMTKELMICNRGKFAKYKISILVILLLVCIFYVYKTNVPDHIMIVPSDSDGHRKYIQIVFERNNTRRLGNQIFGFASILGIAKKIGFEALFDDDSEFFNVFVARGITLVSTTCVTFKAVRCDVIHLRQAYIYDQHEISRVVNDHWFANSIQLHGFFLSWRYFQDIEEQIRQNLQFREEILQEAQTLLNQNRLTYNGTIRRVGIHIRRGDLIKKKNIKYGYVFADMEYITRAMNYFIDKHDKSIIQFIVCSDSIEWAKQHINISNIYFSENHSDGVDLAMLSLCDDIIMTTGTYGWWAGWLAQGEVIYLKHWYTPLSGLSNQSRHGDKDFMPTNWIGLS